MASAPPPRPASAAGLRVLLVATTEDHANRFAAHEVVEAVHAVGQALARVHLQHVRALDLAVLAHERGPEVVFVPDAAPKKCPFLGPLTEKSHEQRASSIYRTHNVCPVHVRKRHRKRKIAKSWKKSADELIDCRLRLSIVDCQIIFLVTLLAATSTCLLQRPLATVLTA